MMKTLLWIIVIGLIVLVIKRIGAGLVGVVMFTLAIFFSIFMLDTFTVVNVRDYIDVSFYDETKENPKEAITNVKDKVIAGGASVIDRINDVGDKAQDRYNTQSIVVHGATVESPDKNEAKPDSEETSNALEPFDNNDTNNEKDVAAGDRSEDITLDSDKAEPSKQDHPELEGYTYLSIGDYNKNLESYRAIMTEKDFAIFKALSPLITIKYEGEQYNFATERGVKGVYIAKKAK